MAQGVVQPPQKAKEKIKNKKKGLSFWAKEKKKKGLGFGGGQTTPKKAKPSDCPLAFSLMLYSP
jgi:hypothetical protein